MATKMQLGPYQGTELWKEGSIRAWVLLRVYGTMELPLNWEYPADLEFLPEIKGERPYFEGGIGWPMRAKWSENGQNSEKDAE